MRRRFVSSRSPADAITIYWVSDTHVYAPVDGNPGAPGATFAQMHLYSGTAKLNKFRIAVNQAKPHLVVHTGDLVHDELGDFDLFLPIWNGIDPSITKELTIGNHDLKPDHAGTYDEVVQILGYGGRPAVAGSVFNRSFPVSNGKFAIRIIMLDTNIWPDGHKSMVTGTIRQEAIDWIRDELSVCPENVALIFMHHNLRNDFVQSEATSLVSAVKARIDARKGNLRVYFLFGHSHNVKVLSRRGFEGVGLSGFLCPALIDYMPGYYVILHVWPDGTLLSQMRAVSYP